jgi:hypothetical protein
MVEGANLYFWMRPKKAVGNVIANTLPKSFQDRENSHQIQYIEISINLKSLLFSKKFSLACHFSLIYNGKFP